MDVYAHAFTLCRETTITTLTSLPDSFLGLRSTGGLSTVRMQASYEEERAAQRPDRSTERTTKQNKRTRERNCCRKEGRHHLYSSIPLVVDACRTANLPIPSEGNNCLPRVSTSPNVFLRCSKNPRQVFARRWRFVEPNRERLSRGKGPLPNSLKQTNHKRKHNTRIHARIPHTIHPFPPGHKAGETAIHVGHTLLLTRLCRATTDRMRAET